MKTTLHLICFCLCLVAIPVQLIEIVSGSGCRALMFSIFFIRTFPGFFYSCDYLYRRYMRR